MKKILTALILIGFGLHGECSKYISLTSSQGRFNSPFKVVLQTFNITQSSTILVSSKNELKTVQVSGKQNLFASTLEFNPIYDRKPNSTLEMKIVEGTKCSLKSITVRRLSRRPSTFIQFDKPIYKPTDIVKFHIIMIDNAGQSFHANNIEIIVRDSRGIQVEQFTNLENQLSGFFVGEFEVGEDVNVGEWTMSVKVDNSQRTKIERKFNVRKYLLPMFNVKINVEDEVYLENDEFEIEIEVEFIYNEKTDGNFSITFKNFEGDEIFNDKFFGTKIQRKFNIKSLKLKAEDLNLPLNLNLIVTFEDSQTGLKSSKSKEINIYENKIHRIHSEYPYPFIPRKTFAVLVKIIDENGNLIESSNRSIKLLQSSYDKLTLKNFKEFNEFLKNGVALFELETHEDDSKMIIEINYKGSKIRDIIKSVKNAIRTYSSVESDSLNLKIAKKIYKVGENIKVMAQSSKIMDKITLIVSSKLGIDHSEIIDCGHVYDCQFFFKSTIEMAPQSIITITQMDSAYRIYKNSVVLKFDEVMTKNFLTIEASQRVAVPGDEINFQISSKTDSTVTLLAFDKRLSFLYEPKEFLKDFLRETLSKPNSYFKTPDGYFDGNNLVTVFDMESWYRCSDSELESLKSKGKIEDYEPEKEEIVEEKIIKNLKDFPFSISSNLNELRKNFSEVWIYDTFKLSNSNSEESSENVFETKTFKLPDTTTVWTVLAYSVHKHGAALIEPFEIESRKKFYIEIISPENPKYGEVLRVDVIAFNNIQEDIEVDIKVKVDEDFFELLETETSFEKSENFIKSLKVKCSKRSLITFYLKPLKNQEFNIKFEAFAKSSDEEFTDSVEIILHLEDESVRHLDHHIDIINFRNRNRTEKHFSFNADHAKKQTIRLSVELSGNILAKGLKYKEHESLLLTETGVQAISRFSKAFFIYKYLLSAKKLGLRQRGGLRQKLKSNFDSIVNTYRNKQDGGFFIHKDNPTSSVWLTAYITKLLGQAMRLKAIDSDSEIVKDALKFLKSKQNLSSNIKFRGSFSENVLKKLPSNPDEDKIYKHFHVTCFVVHAFVVNQDYLDDEMKTVVERAFDYILMDVIHVNNYDASFSAFLYASFNSTYAKNLMEGLENYAHTDGDLKFYKFERNKKTSRASKVLTTAYAIMAYLNLGEFDKAENAIKWLISVKDDNGYFDGIYDTNVALEALTEVEKFSGVDEARISLKFSSDGNLRNGQRSNVLDMSLESATFIDFPVGVLNYSMTVEGEGFAMITTHYEYLAGSWKSSDEFEIFVEVESVEENSGKLKVCGVYFESLTISENYEMKAIIEIEFNNGYVYDSASDPMAQNSMLNDVVVKRGGELLKIYFDELLDEKSCFHILVKKDPKRSQNELKKSSAKIYNYYHKNVFAATYFNIKNFEKT